MTWYTVYDNHPGISYKNDDNESCITYMALSINPNTFDIILFLQAPNQLLFDEKLKPALCANELFQIGQSYTQGVYVLGKVGDIDIINIINIINKITPLDSLYNEICYKIQYFEELFQTNRLNSLLDMLNRNVTITKLTSEYPEKFIGEINKPRVQAYLHRNQQIQIAQQIIIAEVINTCHQNKLDALPADAELLSSMEKELINSEIDADQQLALLEKFRTTCKKQNTLAIEEALAQAIKLIETMRKSCIELEMTPLHGAVSKGYVDYAKLLIARGANIDATDKKESTPLHYAISWKQMNCIKLLIKCGANINLLTKKGESMLDVAVKINNFEIAQCIYKDLSKENFKKLRAKRTFLIGSGLQRFSKFKIARKYNSGSLLFEGFSIIAFYLGKFIQQTNSTALNAIYENFNWFIKNNESDTFLADQYKKLTASGTLLFGCESLTHCIGASVTRLTPDQYLLTIIDRGFFSAWSPVTFGNKRACIQSIKVPQEYIDWTLQQLQNANNNDNSFLEKMFFDIMPEKFNSQWKYHENLCTSLMRVGICFYTNVKTILLYELTQALGHENGWKTYKEFDLFLREAILNKYKNYEQNPAVNDNDVVELLKLGEEIVAEKKAIFNHKYRRHNRF